MSQDKSTVDEIRARFDADVERFSNLETGQSATIDAPLALELVAEAAAACTPKAKRLLDLGCGAGNFSLRLLSRLRLESVTLIDLSQPMLAAAERRIGEASSAQVTAIQSDLRSFSWPHGEFDIVVAAAVLHHLRTKDEWREAFARVYDSLRPGGSFWIFDLVTSGHPPLEALMQRRYADYLTALGGADYQQKVFDYIDREDTPQSLWFQLKLLEDVGFTVIDVLHKNACFAAFGGVK
jgi:tRNA (cmo5U34)-methyltransferase